MKTIKILMLTIALLLAFFLAACGDEPATQSPEAVSASGSANAAPSNASEPGGSASEPSSENSAPGDAEKPESLSVPDSPVTPEEDLVLNEYADLALTAAVVERNAILPGSFVPITVTVVNNGDKTISYVQGSGGYEIPEALSWSVPELQTVLPEDRFGAVTSDFAIKKLAPGESVKFVVYVMTIEQNPEQFDIAAHELYDNENLYIADMEWDVLQENYPWMKPVPPDSYTGEVSFKYSIDDGSSNSFLTEPTGYAQTEIMIGVTE